MSNFDDFDDMVVFHNPEARIYASVEHKTHIHRWMNTLVKNPSAPEEEQELIIQEIYAQTIHLKIVFVFPTRYFGVYHRRELFNGELIPMIANRDFDEQKWNIMVLDALKKGYQFYPIILDQHQKFHKYNDKYGDLISRNILGITGEHLGDPEDVKSFFSPSQLYIAMGILPRPIVDVEREFIKKWMKVNTQRIEQLAKVPTLN